MRKLGSGGIGEIYLVHDLYGNTLALKIGKDLVSITKEYTNLKKFKGKGFIPEAYELDDCSRGGTLYHFFTMEYIEGCTLKNLAQNGRLSIRNKMDIVRVLTKALEQINNEGYVYTDLKYENIMIDKRNGLIRLVDLGSIAKIGDIVKEYTAMYDRKSWNMGSRTAELSYQLFAIMVLFIAMLLNRDLNPEKEKLECILQKLNKAGVPRKLNDILNRCCRGYIDSCGGLYNELSALNIGSINGSKVNMVLDAVIALLSILLAVLVGTIFA